MGDLLIHRVAHPLEQHRESNENFACEILQLFVLALITLNPDSIPLQRRTSRPFLIVFWCKGQPSPWNRQEKDQSDGHLPTWQDRYPKVDLGVVIFLGSTHTLW